MGKFRKKPVEIQAYQFNGGGENERFSFEKWIDNYKGTTSNWFFNGTEYVSFNIVTLEGLMAVSKGDWVIRGVKDEFYPCKPDIFEQTYEAVTE